jgi:PhzF family phenazine biosynthesis protein
MGQRIVQVDAFSAEPFRGNPAAVCVLESPRDEQWMQNVAREMNLSETAFLLRDDAVFALRWFTPAMEVDLCGHATLASAHVLWQDGHIAESETARFTTRSGTLTARRDGEWIEMDFPAEPAYIAEPPAALMEALGNPMAAYVGRNRFDYIVEVDSERAVLELEPDLSRLRRVTTRGVMVTAASPSPDHHFVSRFFAPAAGVDEDPVTGSAHCCLAPHWAERLRRQELIGYQASSRGGIVRVRCAGDRVLLSGRAVTVMVGELLA